MDKIRPYAKAVVTFIAAVVTNLAANLAAEGAVFPQDIKGWAILILTTVGATALTFGVPNKPLPKQVDKYLEGEGQVAIPAGLPVTKRRRRPVI